MTSKGHFQPKAFYDSNMSVPHLFANEDSLRAAFKCLCCYQGEGIFCTKGTKAMCVILTTQAHHYWGMQYSI